MDYTKRSPVMETAALTLGVIAFAGSVCVYPGIICAALGIILAILSRGGAQTLSSKAKGALAINICAMAFTIILVGLSLLLAYTVFGGVDEMMKFYESSQNMSYEEMYKYIFEMLNQAQPH